MAPHHLVQPGLDHRNLDGCGERDEPVDGVGGGTGVQTVNEEEPLLIKTGGRCSVMGDRNQWTQLQRLRLFLPSLQFARDFSDRGQFEEKADWHLK